MTYLCHPEKSQRRFAIWRNGAFLFQCYSGFFLSSGCSFSGGVLRGLASGTGRWSCRSVAGGGAGLASGRCTGLEDGCGGGLTGCGEGVAGLGCGSPGWARRSGAGDASGAAGLGAGRSG